MKDLIDEKNRQEKMKRSIIKYWNVSYGSPEAIGGEEEEKEREHAAGIYPQEIMSMRRVRVKTGRDRGNRRGVTDKNPTDPA